MNTLHKARFPLDVSRSASWYESYDASVCFRSIIFTLRHRSSKLDSQESWKWQVLTSYFGFSTWRFCFSLKVKVWFTDSSTLTFSIMNLFYFQPRARGRVRQSTQYYCTTAQGRFFMDRKWCYIDLIHALDEHTNCMFVPLMQCGSSATLKKNIFVFPLLLFESGTNKLVC